MAYTGIFCTEAEMQFKAGENRDTTGDTEANHNQIAAEVESFINSTCRYNFSDSYSSMSADVRAILKEAASNLSAVYLIQYNMAGYSSRIEAEDMINILMSRFNACIEILKDQKLVTYLNSTAIGTQASDTTDEVTITKNASGVISVKTGNGANQAVVLGTGGTFAKNLLDATTAYPAGDGGALTNLSSVIIPLHIYSNGSALMISHNSGSKFFQKTIPLSISPTVNAGTWAYENTATEALPYSSRFTNNTSHANADAITFSPIPTLPAGTYTFYTRFTYQNVNGILDILIDGSSKGTIDQYGASTTHNNIATITGIVLTNATHTIKLLVNGKNASSSNYYVNFSEISLVKTA